MFPAVSLGFTILDEIFAYAFSKTCVLFLQIIANINLPFDFQAAKEKRWCSEDVVQTVRVTAIIVLVVALVVEISLSSLSLLLFILLLHYMLWKLAVLFSCLFE